jgi:hypothetical protein
MTVVVLLAGIDPYLGDGHHGTRVVSSTEEFSPAVALGAELPSGGTTLQLAADAGFVAGDLIMIHRTTSDGLDAPPRDAGRFDLDSTDLGFFQLFRVTSGSGSTFEIDPSAQLRFPMSGTQAVLVHEFDALTVTDAGRMTTRPWDGSSGGILAFFAKGTVRVDGVIDVSGAGSRGGAPIVDTAGNAPETFGCVDPDEPSPRGAFKGESFFSAYFGPAASGSGRAITGGGGGICHNSGGGGGGHAGAGGQGGATWTADGSRDVGGQGGMAISASPQRLTFGGGGGAGEAHHGSTNNGGSRGGGILFVRALSVAGNGALLADGMTSPMVDDAAGGGGAGGTVHLTVASSINCGRISAHGGSGNINPCLCEGSSGGGGGGRVVLQADSLSCPVDVSAGVGGNYNSGTTFEFRLAQPDFTTQPLHAGEVVSIDGGIRPEPSDLMPTLLRREYIVGCGCSGAPVEGFALVLLALLRGRYARRRADHVGAARAP